MRIASFTTVFPNPRQPVFGLFVLERLRHAARLDQIDVVAPVPWFFRLSVDARSTSCSGLRVCRPPFWYLPGVLNRANARLLYRSALPLMRRLHHERRFELIDGHFGWPDGVAGSMLAQALGLPSVTTLRGSELLWAERRPIRAEMSQWLPRCQRVIALSRELASLALSLGVPGNRLEVIENGVDTLRFTPGARTAARRALGFPHDGRLILSVGHQVPRKGFHHLIEAYAIVHRERPDTRLAIVGGRSSGTDDYPRQLRELVQRHKLEHCVTFAGAVAPDAVALWLRAADVFTLASSREGSPNAVWEAMACGRPVVATRVGGVEAMVPRTAGLLVSVPVEPPELAKAIRTALERQWDTQAIRDYAVRHDWDSVAMQVHQAWTCAVTEARARPACLSEL